MEKEVLLNRLEDSSIEVRDVAAELSRKRWDSLPQVTDNYVVHARGFSIGDRFWFDAYNLYTEHTHLWNEYISPEIGYGTYDGDWASFAEGIDEPWLYWSVVSPGNLVVQQPDASDISSTHFQQILDVLNALDAPNDARVTFYDDDSGHTIFAGVFYAQQD